MTFWSAPIDVLGLDGDDTLWRCEDHFAAAQDQLRTLLSPFADPAAVDAGFDACQRHRLPVYGYGAKGFTLAAVETAVQLAGTALDAALVTDVLALGERLLTAPVELLDGAEQAVAVLRDAGHRLVLITKGDLVDQERKLRMSGLIAYFDHVEILSEKNAANYRRLLTLLECPPQRFLMVGNSPRSDVLPVVEIGARAVHVPYHLTWHHEHVDADQWQDHPGARSVTDLSELAATLERHRGT